MSAGSGHISRVDSLLAACDKLQSRLDAEWNESDHPRDEDGKFGNGGGSARSGSSSKLPFVKSLYETHGTGKKISEHLKSVSDDKLKTAHSLLTRHGDMMDEHDRETRIAVENEIKRREQGQHNWHNKEIKKGQGEMLATYGVTEELNKNAEFLGFQPAYEKFTPPKFNKSSENNIQNKYKSNVSSAREANEKVLESVWGKKDSVERCDSVSAACDWLHYRINTVFLKNGWE